MIRSIDREKCIGCGTCQKTCPLDVFRVYPEPGLASPCVAACPMHNAIRESHLLLQLGKVEEAAAHIWKENPLAAVTGRVCPHFCESKCSRSDVDEAVNISGIERFLGDLALELPPAPTAESHIFPVAVVGSGPAGLACAAELAGRGFRVSVFEAREEAGGMLRYGIPEYRLPSDVLAKLVEKLRAVGVTFRCGQRLGRDFTVESLREQGFGAIFLGIGAGLPKTAAIQGAEGPGLLMGLDFLEDVRTRKIRSVSGRAVVVGGGDVAMDVAQSLARLGATSVSVVSLEAEGQLPAFRHNIDDALALGVRFVPSASVRGALRRDGLISGVELNPCLSVFDTQGRFAPVIDESASSILEADMLVFAIGQSCDLTGVPEAAQAGSRNLQADAVTCQTALPWLFAAGDAVTGPGSAAAAIAGGKRAAMAMALFLRGGDLGTLAAWDLPVAAPLAHPADHRPQKRQKAGSAASLLESPACSPISCQASCPDSAQPGNFAELHGGLSLPALLAESNRCLTCGSKAVLEYTDDCMTCFSCEIYCPENAVYVNPIKEDWPRALAPLPKTAD